MKVNRIILKILIALLILITLIYSFISITISGLYPSNIKRFYAIIIFIVLLGLIRILIFINDLLEKKK